MSVGVGEFVGSGVNEGAGVALLVGNKDVGRGVNDGAGVALLVGDKGVSDG